MSPFQSLVRALKITVNLPSAVCLTRIRELQNRGMLTIVDKFRIKAYTAVGRNLTVHDWQEIHDPDFGTVVAKSRCGRIVDRRVLIHLVLNQPPCKRCSQLRAATMGTMTSTAPGREERIAPRP